LQSLKNLSAQVGIPHGPELVNGKDIKNNICKVINYTCFVKAIFKRLKKLVSSPKMAK